MHCKIFLFIITVIIISSCSKYNTNISDNSISNEEKKEILIQKKILINEMMKASQLLHQVSWPILIKNKKKCVLNNTKLYGLIYADINDVPEKDYKIFIDIFNSKIEKKYFKKYGVDNFPIIISVAKDSPAFIEGLKKNDIVIEINNKSTRNFRKLLNKNLKESNEIHLTLLRNNKVIKKNITGIKGCVYNVQPIPSGAPNAFADGNKVFITLAAIKLARTIDEIAFLIGHEIAHNIYHYRSFSASEANYMGINYLDKPKIREAKSLFIWTNEKKEIEADIEGLKLAFNAGYTLENVNEYWRRLSVFNPELISKSINIYKSNAFRATLISKTLEELKRNKNEKNR